MTGRLDPAAHAWMRAPAVRRVMAALNTEDAEAARYVGGCVRNTVMGRPVDDVDIATRLDPLDVSARLEAAGLKVVPTGIDHGTVTAVADGAPFEITTLRRDVETFGRRAVVAFTTDWSEDAARRDFRLNAIYCAQDGSLFDPYDGVADARAGRVIFIGDARARIAEDHLRILRFYRFNAWYGAGIDPAGQAACSAMAETLKALSAERVWKELKKLFSAPDPSGAVKAMQEGNVLKAVIPGPLDFRLLLSLINTDREMSRAPDPLLRLAALAGRDEAAMTALCTQMKASKAENAKAAALCGPVNSVGASRIGPKASQRDLAKLAYAVGSQAASGRVRLDEAQGLGDARDALAFLDTFEPPTFPVKGRDLIAAGAPRGPQLGAMLAELERDWIESGFSLSREALVARALESGA